MPGDHNLCVERHVRHDCHLPGHALMRRHDDLPRHIDLRQSAVLSWHGYLYRGRELRRGHHLRAEPDVQCHRADLLQ